MGIALHRHECSLTSSRDSAKLLRLKGSALAMLTDGSAAGSSPASCSVSYAPTQADSAASASSGRARPRAMPDLQAVAHEVCRTLHTCA